MQAVDFVRSAQAAAPAITGRAGAVGERIHRAIAATRRVVAVNTNLGVVLLAAPILHAAALQPPPRTQAALARRLGKVLARLTVADAELAFEAIRVARPGGLGTSARHDVHGPAQASLLEAMREAAERDMVARQYANGYAEVIETGLKRIAMVRAVGYDWRWTATAVYLAFLARYPDSHIARKYGLEQAEVVRDAASEYDRALGQAEDPATLAESLLKWDDALKARGVNPGTSADLTVATLLFSFLCGSQVENYARHGERRGADERVGTLPTE
jgi:triphosphoribosyl-dephospho-CoA synthase